MLQTQPDNHPFGRQDGESINILIACMFASF